MVHALSRDEARRIIVRAQLLDAERPGDVVEVAEQLGKIKIDPMAVIAPCEHTVGWSRIGWSYEPGQLKKAVEDDHLLFEFDGAFRATSLLPFMRVRMGLEFLHPSTRQWVEANDRFRSDIVARLRAEGPLPAGAIDDTSQVAHRSEAGWYGPTQVPRMLEVLQHTGDVAVVRREGRNRIWDIADRAYPVAAADVSPEDARTALEERRLQAAGLAKQKAPWSRVGMAGEAAVVQDSAWKFRVDPAAIEALGDDRGGRVAILNPYDSVLFDRPRLTEVFGFTYVLEQFKPASQRVYGKFAHPILVGDRFVGLLDAAVDRKREELQVTAIHELVPFEPEEHDMIRAELTDLASWLGVTITGLP